MHIALAAGFGLSYANGLTHLAPNGPANATNGLALNFHPHLVLSNCASSMSTRRPLRFSKRS